MFVATWDGRGPRRTRRGNRSIGVSLQGEVITASVLKLLQSIVSELVPGLTLEVGFQKAAEELVNAQYQEKAKGAANGWLFRTAVMCLLPQPII